MVNPILKLPADPPLLDTQLLLPIGDKLIIRTSIFDPFVQYHEGDDMYLATIVQNGTAYPGYWILTNDSNTRDARRIGTFLRYSGKKHIDLILTLAPLPSEVN